MLRVGQKVVCVYNGSDEPGSWFGDIPKVNHIYTICGFEVVDGVDCLLLEEIRNKYITNNGDISEAYAAYRFRPLVEKKTDISIFSEILRKVTQGEKLDA